MLVLSRKAGESVRVAGGLTVKVLQVRGDKVRLGFDAPRDLTIAREEVADDCESQNNLARAASIEERCERLHSNV